MNVDKVLEVFRKFIDTKLDSFSISNPVVGLFKPLIKRVVDNNIQKLVPTLSLLSDSEGNIDIKEIIPEMIDNVKSMEPFSIHTDIIGEIVIGDGRIILNIPMTDRRLVLDSTDLEDLKNLILNS